MQQQKTYKKPVNVFAWLARLWRGQGVEKTPLQVDKKRPKQLHLLACQIHGSHYYQCINLVESKQIQVGERLILTREPDNEYDPYAIEVYNQKGVKLGYVPKNHNRVIAELMDQHCAIDAVVERVNGKEWEPVRIAVEWHQ